MASLAEDVTLRGRWPLVCNGIYVRQSDLARSALEVVPIAGHVAGRFRVAQRAGFDVNPVTWTTLADHGIAIRGPHRDRLAIHTDCQELRRWSLSNLNGYWRRWTKRALDVRALPRRAAAAGVLGAPRLHYTITSGQIATKEAAGHYACTVFDPGWHALIEDALAFWLESPAPVVYRHRPLRRRHDASRFVAAVIDAANQLARAQRLRTATVPAGSRRVLLAASRVRSRSPSPLRRSRNVQVRDPRG
ncbi:MAG: hypothetical protein JOZ07_11130 [Solirubrobacterales bacterium]|nr:hypothetical protein [Solirubrobacterales bacterium]